MALKQYARGLWASFASLTDAFKSPNGMEENLRTIDDHLGLYTLLAPQAPGTALPAAPGDGDGQIFTDGSYATFNAGTWRTYLPRRGIRAVLAAGTESWLNTGTGWGQFSVVDSTAAVALATQAGAAQVALAVAARTGAEAAQTATLTTADQAAAGARARPSIAAANADSTIAIGQSFSAPLADGTLQAYLKTASSGSSATAIGLPFASGAFEQRALKGLLARQSSARNRAVLGTQQATASQVIFTSSIASVAMTGVFVSCRLLVTGAPYPSGPYDAAVFAGGLRMQVFNGGTLVASKDLARLPGTEIWYYRDDTPIANFTELKVFASGAAGVTLRFEEPTIYLDGGYPNAEIDARNTAISTAVSELVKQVLAGVSRQGAAANLLTGATGFVVNPASSNQLIASLAATLTAASCMFKLDVVGMTYPALATDVGLLFQVFTGVSTLVASVSPTRIGATNMWFVDRTPLSGGPHTSAKLIANAPAGVTLTFTECVFTDGQALPLPLEQHLVALKADTLTAAATAAATQATTIAQQQIATALANFPGLYPTDPMTAIAMAKVRRVEFVMSGDSNAIKDGTGWDDGLNYALATLGFAQYATGIYAANGWANQGYTSGASNFGASTGAPAAQEAFWPGSSNDAQMYGYIPDGSIFNNSVNNGFNGASLTATSGMVNQRLLWHYAWSPFASGAGSFRTGIRREDAPYNTLVNGPLTSTNGAPAYRIDTLELPAGTRNFPIGFKFYNPGGTVITGPFINYWHRIEAPDVAAGFSVHTLQYQSGESLYDMAAKLLAMSPVKLTRFYQEVRRLPLSSGQRPIVVDFTNSGVNDQNETSFPSLGPGAFTDPTGPDAYIDNYKALRARKEAMYVAAGGDVREMFWVIIPSHVVSSPELPKLVAYRAAAKAYALTVPRTFVIDMSEVMTVAEALSLGDYLDNGADRNHLYQQGYERYSLRGLQRNLPL